MKRGCLISFYIVAAVLILAGLLSACSAAPTLRYCEHVEYVRDGSKIHLKAECNAPVGGMPGV